MLRRRTPDPPWESWTAPAQAPADIVQRLNRTLNDVMRAPDVVERLEKLGAEPAGNTPEAFGKLVRDEHEGWKALIQRARIKPE